MPGADLLRRGPPLRARADRGSRAGPGLSLRGGARRRAPLAARGRPVPATDDPPDRSLAAVPCRVRLLSRRGPPRASLHTEQGRRPAWAGGRCPARARAPDVERAGRGLAASPDVDRRPDLRGRGRPRDAGVHPLPPRHQYSPRRGGTRLRGVHAPVPGVVERAPHPVALLDGGDDDDVRRPRRPRRLEHVDGLARGDAGTGLVADADRGGTLPPTGSTSGSATSRRASSPRTRCCRR